MSAPVNAISPLPFDEANFASVRRILILAGPLVFSQMGVMLMQIVDGIFLARYCQSAIAAVGPAGMSFWLICGLFIGMVGYTNTFVAQYVGARRPERVGSAVWQGIYLAIAAGAVLAACAPLAEPFFDAIGHEEQIRANEVIYFRILCLGGVTFALSSAIAGFYAGRHDNVTLMIAHIIGALTNALLNAVLIFGLAGFPEMGIAGAAWATVIAHAVQILVMGVLLFKPRFRAEFATWRSRAVNFSLMWRLARYGFPNGVRFVIEIAAWTVFLLIIGRIDSQGLAASNIAWRINGMAFFPVIGLSVAIAMLVGQAQGANRPDLSRKATHRGLLIGQAWMASAAAVMVLAPDALLALFFGEVETQAQMAIYQMSVNLLWFVAAYCLVDNFNIILMAMLAGAGDTRWMLLTSGALHMVFLIVLLLLMAAGVGTYGLWLAATIFIGCVVVAWVIRFRSHAWETKQVIEQAPPDVVNPAFAGPSASEI